jgi:hypothetical protein
MTSHVKRALLALAVVSSFAAAAPSAAFASGSNEFCFNTIVPPGGGCSSGVDRDIAQLRAQTDGNTAVCVGVGSSPSGLATDVKPWQCANHSVISQSGIPPFQAWPSGTARGYAKCFNWDANWQVLACQVYWYS